MQHNPAITRWDKGPKQVVPTQGSFKWLSGTPACVKKSGQPSPERSPGNVQLYNGRKPAVGTPTSSSDGLFAFCCNRLPLEEANTNCFSYAPRRFEVAAVCFCG